MRQFKFRAWSKTGKHYIANEPDKWSPFITLEGSLGYNHYGNYDTEDDPNNYIMEQYTGLDDINGKKIFEGDIVNYQDKNYFIHFKYGSYFIGQQDDKLIESVFLIKRKLLEIIGNIHENPELLEVTT